MVFIIQLAIRKMGRCVYEIVILLREIFNQVWLNYFPAQWQNDFNLTAFSFPSLFAEAQYQHLQIALTHKTPEV